MPLNTTTTAVTIYPNRARVTRAGQASLEAGSHVLEVRDLPLALHEDSLRARGQGSAQAVLRGVSVHRAHYDAPPVERIQALEAEIEQIETDYAGLDHRDETLEQELKHLDALGAQTDTAARGIFLRNRSPQQVGELYDFIRERRDTLRADQRDLATQRRALERTLARKRRELKELQSARPATRYTAAIEVEVRQPGTLSVELDYVVNNARWTPLYDLRLGDDALTVDYLAEVTQNTGEDWAGAALTLSTAFPSLNLDLPEQSPWFIDQAAVAMARPKMAARSAMPAPASPAPMQAAAMAEPDMEMDFMIEHEAAEVSAEGAALTYRLGGSSDVPGNGDPRKVQVASLSLPARVDYLCVPREDLAVYRRATITNDSEYTLLEGSAQLFEHDSFMGSIRLAQTAPNLEIELALGVDERMTVERELTAREVDKKMIGDRRRIRYAYDITLHNLTGAAQALELRDQIPVARNEQIKVKLEKSTPNVSEQTRLNELVWTLTLADGAKQSFAYEYTVEHPRDMQVVGLA